nr:glucomannan 4-beta-mannosyltransferase 1 [Ipomoea batatas]
MCLHRANAVLVGLLGGSGVNEWVVTEKLGYALNRLRIPRTQEWQFMIDRIHLPEFLMGLNLMHTAVYDLMYGYQTLWGSKKTDDNAKLLNTTSLEVISNVAI